MCHFNEATNADLASRSMLRQRLITLQSIIKLFLPGAVIIAVKQWQPRSGWPNISYDHVCVWYISLWLTEWNRHRFPPMYWKEKNTSSELSHMNELEVLTLLTCGFLTCFKKALTSVYSPPSSIVSSSLLLYFCLPSGKLDISQTNCSSHQIYPTRHPLALWLLYRCLQVTQINAQWQINAGFYLSVPTTAMTGGMICTYVSFLWTGCRRF